MPRSRSSRPSAVFASFIASTPKRRMYLPHPRCGSGVTSSTASPTANRAPAGRSGVAAGRSRRTDWSPGGRPPPGSSAAADHGPRSGRRSRSPGRPCPRRRRSSGRRSFPLGGRSRRRSSTSRSRSAPAGSRSARATRAVAAAPPAPSSPRPEPLRAQAWWTASILALPRPPEVRRLGQEVDPDLHLQLLFSPSCVRDVLTCTTPAGLASNSPGARVARLAFVDEDERPRVAAGDLRDRRGCRLDRVDDKPKRAAEPAGCGACASGRRRRSASTTTPTTGTSSPSRSSCSGRSRCSRSPTPAPGSRRCARSTRSIGAADHPGRC